MGLYRLWLRGEWRRRWPSLLALVAMVAVAGGAVLLAAGGARRADSAFARFYERVGAPTLAAQAIGLESGSLDKYDGVLDDLDRLAAIPGVKRVQALAWMAVSADPENAGYFAIATVGDTAGTADLASRTIAGRTPDPSEVASVVVNEDAVRIAGLHVGQHLELSALSPAQQDLWLGSDEKAPASRYDVEVVGIVRGAEDISDSPEPYVAVTEGFYRAHHEEIASCICVVWIRSEPGATAAVTAAVNDIVGPRGMAVAPVEALGRRITHAIGVELNALRVGALVAAVAGLLLVTLALLRQAADSVEEVRVRRALGLGPRHEAIGAALVALPALVLGAAVAVGLAVALSPLLPQGRARKAEPDPGIWWDGPVVVLGVVAIVLVGLVVAALVGWSTARRVVRTDAPSVRHAHRFGGGVLPAAATLGLGFAADPGRDRLRVSAWSGVLGVALAVGAAATVVTIRSSTDHLLATPPLFGAPYDLTADGDSVDREALATSAAAMAGVDQVAVLESIDGASFTVEGPAGTRLVDPSAFRSFRGELGSTVQEGRRPGADDEVLLGPLLAKELGVDVGDELAVLGAGSDGVSYRVVGLGIEGSVDELDTAFTLRSDGLQRLCTLSEDPAGCETSPDTTLIDVSPDAAGREALAALADAGAAPVEVPSIVGSLDDVGVVPVVLAGLLALLGIVGLVHGLLVALRRRRRDLGIVRALGFTPAQAAATLRWQAAALALAGGLVGLMVGAIAGRVLWRLLASGIGAVVVVEVPPATLLLPLAAVAVGLLVAVLPAHRAAHLRPADALRSE